MLAAALELFERDGYGNVAMSRIANSAGVATGTIYTYFRSKEELANALYRRSKTALAGELLSEPDDGDARGGFGRFWRSLIHFATTQPVALSFLENHRHDVYLDDESRALGARIDAGAAEFVRSGQRSGQIRPGSPEALTALVFGAFVGLLRAGHEGRLTVDEQLLADMEGTVWGLLAPPGRRDEEIDEGRGQR